MKIERYTKWFKYDTGVNTLAKFQNQEADAGATVYGTYTYDNNGNQTKEGDSRYFEWDYADRLRCFYNQAGTSEPTNYTTYLYDAGGSRVKKICRKSATQYEVIVYIDGVYERRYTYNGTTPGESNDRSELFVMDNASRVIRQRIGTDPDDGVTPAIRYIIDNNLGSSTVELDTSAALVDREEYFPFGETSFGGYGKKRYRYVGKEKDEESGLYYYGARYYAPWVCRFVSVDPLAGKYAQLTPYNYASNTPIGSFDLDGLQKEGSGDSGGGSEPQSQSSSPRTEKSKDGLTTRTITEEVIVKDGKTIKVSHVKEKFKYYLGSDNSVVRTSLPTGKGKTFNANDPRLKGIDNSPEDGVDIRISDPVGSRHAMIKLDIRWGSASYSTETDITPMPKQIPNNASSTSTESLDSESTFDDLHKNITDASADDSIEDSPPTPPDAATLCFTCFNGESLAHWDKGVDNIVKWLDSNPDYGLRIMADGGSDPIWSNTWDDGIFTTYREDTDARFDILYNAIQIAGGDTTRLERAFLNADGRTLLIQTISKK